MAGRFPETDIIEARLKLSERAIELIADLLSSSKMRRAQTVEKRHGETFPLAHAPSIALVPNEERYPSQKRLSREMGIPCVEPEPATCHYVCEYSPSSTPCDQSVTASSLAGRLKS